jgi:hypothetical protein
MLMEMKKKENEKEQFPIDDNVVMNEKVIIPIASLSSCVHNSFTTVSLV